MCCDTRASNTDRPLEWNMCTFRTKTRQRIVNLCLPPSCLWTGSSKVNLNQRSTKAVPIFYCSKCLETTGRTLILMLSKHALILPNSIFVTRSITNFFNHELQKSIIRDDYRELIELSIIFLGGDNKSKIKIRHPGATGNRASTMDGKSYLLFENYSLSSKWALRRNERCKVFAYSLWQFIWSPGLDALW